MLCPRRLRLIIKGSSDVTCLTLDRLALWGYLAWPAWTGSTGRLDRLAWPIGWTGSLDQLAWLLLLDGGNSNWQRRLKLYAPAAHTPHGSALSSCQLMHDIIDRNSIHIVLLETQVHHKCISQFWEFSCKCTSAWLDFLYLDRVYNFIVFQPGAWGWKFPTPRNDLVKAWKFSIIFAYSRPIWCSAFW